MLTVTASQLAELAASRRASHEVGWVVDTLRAAYTDAVSMLDDALLRREVEACLQRCDAIGLKTDGDRLGLCMLDIVLMPGVRDLPELPALIERFAQPDQPLLVTLALAAPPQFWNLLMERAGATRRARGMIE